MRTRAPARVWLVDKPEGPTSHDIVTRARRRLGRKVKVGHAGTLDPFATGLLIVLVGKATRLSRYLTDLDKTYIAGVALGTRSESGDTEGPFTPGGDVPAEESIAAAVRAMAGVSDQEVPALSAVKVDGERLYRRTRRGEVVDERPRREITISSVRALDLTSDRRLLTLELSVSKGTYIRQVATDLGETLGCGGYCASLRRTRIGSLTVDHAHDIDDLELGLGLRPHEALSHLPRRDLDADEAGRVSHGSTLEGGEEGSVVLTHGDETVAVARGDGTTLRPEVVLV